MVKRKFFRKIYRPRIFLPIMVSGVGTYSMKRAFDISMKKYIAYDNIVTSHYQSSLLTFRLSGKNPITE
jgi:hypothetical protein